MSPRLLLVAGSVIILTSLCSVLFMSSSAARPEPVVRSGRALAVAARAAVEAELLSSSRQARLPGASKKRREDAGQSASLATVEAEVYAASRQGDLPEAGRAFATRSQADTPRALPHQQQQEEKGCSTLPFTELPGAMELHGARDQTMVRSVVRSF